jgi:hypothetical protein
MNPPVPISDVMTMIRELQQRDGLPSQRPPTPPSRPS